MSDYRIRIVKVVSGNALAHLRFQALSLNLISVVCVLYYSQLTADAKRR